MQHGTGREVVQEAVENTLAVLMRGVKHADVRAALLNALRVLESDNDLDERGVYGPDYGFDAKQYAEGIALGARPKVVKYLGPTGSIRDTRPDTLGR